MLQDLSFTSSEDHSQIIIGICLMFSIPLKKGIFNSFYIYSKSSLFEGDSYFILVVVGSCDKAEPFLDRDQSCFALFRFVALPLTILILASLRFSLEFVLSHCNDTETCLQFSAAWVLLSSLQHGFYCTNPVGLQGEI